MEGDRLAHVFRRYQNRKEHTVLVSDDVPGLVVQPMRRRIKHGRRREVVGSLPVEIWRNAAGVAGRAPIGLPTLRHRDVNPGVKPCLSVRSMRARPASRALLLKPWYQSDATGPDSLHAAAALKAKNAKASLITITRLSMPNFWPVRFDRLCRRVHHPLICGAGALRYSGVRFAFFWASSRRRSMRLVCAI